MTKSTIKVVWCYFPNNRSAAIDRVVHHSIIVEFGKQTSSHRADEAAMRRQELA